MSELTTLLEDGTQLDSKEVSRRVNEGVSFIRSEDVKPYTSLNITLAEQNQNTVDGICASPGFISGQAKIVLSKDDVSKVSSSDIMVAIGTDFDLLEVMNICAGIVTEEGGLLSHASVVSRELKKPCLIGVLNATKIFSDGDQLELNASDGKIVIKHRTA